LPPLTLRSLISLRRRRRTSDPPPGEIVEERLPFPAAAVRALTVLALLLLAFAFFAVPVPA
jgi:hypothetical protein